MSEANPIRNSESGSSILPKQNTTITELKDVELQVLKSGLSLSDAAALKSHANGIKEDADFIYFGFKKLEKEVIYEIVTTSEIKFRVMDKDSQRVQLPISWYYKATRKSYFTGK